VQTHFQRGLERFGVEWFAGIEVNSTRLIEHYVVNDYGIGVTVATPLLGFPLVVIGAAWAGKLSPITQQFLAEVEIEANAVKRSTKSR